MIVQAHVYTSRPRPTTDKKNEESEEMCPLTIPDGVLLQQVHHVDVRNTAALLHQSIAVRYFTTTGAT